MSRHRDRGLRNPDTAVTVGLLRLEQGLPVRCPVTWGRHFRFWNTVAG